ncbi:MAG TPA: selenide, water dikinase SelD [Chryseolinea sp.]|nr:selenide, water dikinase SelD [Chryseolinea sp.]
MEETSEIRLTQYSHGAGCGCKISPAVLDKILHSQLASPVFPSLLVGNESKDDAAVFDIGDGICIVSTTDFFMPIVDDPALFGAIASVNAISDVYAMGGEPFMAIAILGWPIDKIPAHFAKQVLEGSRKVCHQASMPLAGGHSIDCPEPVFGLAVTGRVSKENLKRNDSARAGSLLYLTKPLGVGIITTAQKKGVVQGEHFQHAVDSMLTLNWLGARASKLQCVSAMTDVTGFGLLGHLAEVCTGSKLSAEIWYASVPKFDFLQQYIDQKCIPGGTTRNWESYKSSIGPITEEQKSVLADPQTSGGLLIVVDAESREVFEKEMFAQGYRLAPFGKLEARRETLITIH